MVGGFHLQCFCISRFLHPPHGDFPRLTAAFSLLFQYDVVPIQTSAVICPCPHPSMVRNQPDSCSPLAIPGASSGHCPGMEGPGKPATQGSELRTQTAMQASQPRKKRPEDFKFGKILGEGSFSTVRNLHSI